MRKENKKLESLKNDEILFDSSNLKSMNVVRGGAGWTWTYPAPKFEPVSDITYISTRVTI